MVFGRIYTSKAVKGLRVEIFAGFGPIREIKFHKI